MKLCGWRPFAVALALTVTACAPGSGSGDAVENESTPAPDGRSAGTPSTTTSARPVDVASSGDGLRIGDGRAILAASAGSTTLVATTAGVHVVVGDVATPLDVGIDRAAAIGVSPDGSRAVVARADRTELWRVADRVELLDSFGPATSIAFTGDDRLLVVADEAIELRATADGALVSRHEDPVGRRHGPAAVDPGGAWWAVPVLGSGDAIELVVSRAGVEPTVVTLGQAESRTIGQATTLDSTGAIVLGLSENGDRFEGGELVTWDVESGGSLWSRQLEPGELWDVDGAGQLAVVGREWLTLIGRDGTEVRSEKLPPGFPVSAVHGMADGGFAVVLQDGSRLAVDRTGDIESQPIDLPRFALASQRSADRSAVAVVDHHGAITVLGPDARPRGQVDAFVAGTINDIAVSPTAGFALATSTGAIRLIDPSDPGGPAATELPHPEGTVDSVVFSPDGERLITGVAERRSEVIFDDTVAVWDLADRRRIVEIGGEREEVQDCSSFFNVLRQASDGSFVVGVSHDFTVFVLDGATYERRLTLPPHGGPVLDIALSPDDGTLVTTAQDSTVRVWDPATGALLADYTAPLGGYRSIDFLPDGSGLVAADFTGALTVIDPSTGETTSIFESSISGAADVEISPDGQLVASSDGPILRLWSVATGEVVADYLGHSASVTTAAFSDDSGMVISGSADGTAMLWDLRSS